MCQRLEHLCVCGMPCLMPFNVHRTLEDYSMYWHGSRHRTPFTAGNFKEMAGRQACSLTKSQLCCGTL